MGRTRTSTSKPGTPVPGNPGTAGEPTATESPPGHWTLAVRRADSVQAAEASTDRACGVVFVSNPPSTLEALEARLMTLLREAEAAEPDDGTKPVPPALQRAVRGLVQWQAEIASTGGESSFGAIVLLDSVQSPSVACVGECEPTITTDGLALTQSWRVLRGKTGAVARVAVLRPGRVGHLALAWASGQKPRPHGTMEADWALEGPPPPTGLPGLINRLQERLDTAQASASTMLSELLPGRALVAEVVAEADAPEAPQEAETVATLAPTETAPVAVPETEAWPRASGVATEPTKAPLPELAWAKTPAPALDLKPAAPSEPENDPPETAELAPSADPESPPAELPVAPESTRAPESALAPESTWAPESTREPESTPEPESPKADESSETPARPSAFQWTAHFTLPEASPSSIQPESAIESDDSAPTAAHAAEPNPTQTTKAFLTEPTSLSTRELKRALAKLASTPALDVMPAAPSEPAKRQPEEAALAPSASPEPPAPGSPMASESTEIPARPSAFQWAAKLALPKISIPAFKPRSVVETESEDAAATAAAPAETNPAETTKTPTAEPKPQSTWESKLAWAKQRFPTLHFRPLAPSEPATSRSDSAELAPSAVPETFPRESPVAPESTEAPARRPAFQWAAKLALPKISIPGFKPKSVVETRSENAASTAAARATDANGTQALAPTKAAKVDPAIPEPLISTPTSMSVPPTSPMWTTSTSAPEPDAVSKWLSKFEPPKFGAQAHEPKPAIRPESRTPAPSPVPEHPELTSSPGAAERAMPAPAPAAMPAPAAIPKTPKSWRRTFTPAQGPATPDSTASAPQPTTPSLPTALQPLRRMLVERVTLVVDSISSMVKRVAAHRPRPWPARGILAMPKRSPGTTASLRRPPAGTATAPAKRPAGTATAAAKQPAGTTTVPAKRPTGSTTVPGKRPPGTTAVPGNRPAGFTSVPGRRPAGVTSAVRKPTVGTTTTLRRPPVGTATRRPHRLVVPPPESFTDVLYELLRHVPVPTFSGSRTEASLGARVCCVVAATLLLFGLGWMMGNLAEPERRTVSTLSPMARTLSAMGLGPGSYVCMINSLPPGAAISIDGKPIDAVTPIDVEMTPGDHRVTFSLAHLGEGSFPVSGRARERVTLMPDLSGSIDIRPPETGSRVMVAIDGSPYGTAPMTVQHLSPGNHEVTLTSPNSLPWERVVTVRVGETVGITATPQRTKSSGVLLVRASEVDEDGHQVAESARVWIDGDYRGRTPLRLELSRGPHSIRAELNGETAPVQLIDLPGGNQRYADFSFGDKGDNTEITATLQPASRKHGPQILVSIDGAKPADLEGVWLSVRGDNGVWRRCPVPVIVSAHGVSGTVAFPPPNVKASMNAPYYASAHRKSGEEYFSEIQTARGR